MIETTFPHHLTKRSIRAALEEDLGLAGDITGNAVIAPDETMTCSITSREQGVIAGLPLAINAFRVHDPSIEFTRKMHDGDKVEVGDVVLTIKGNSRAILAAERVALNYLCHLSGIASLTAKFVEQVEGTKAAICCTRKTLPGLRAFQKYAVRAGGGRNHRYGLDQAILIKDNHIASAGGIKEVLDKVRINASHMVRVEIEVDTLEQLQEVLNYKVDAVLLDNMSPDTLKKAVALVEGRAICEASGGVNLQTVKRIAQSGVNLISVGALTHSAPVFDFGLDEA
ncbi:MAG: carboxylating nicotinate-nucleotide diphosphorylase [Hyphomicrobiaceae bacterium]|nr:carboxylating nicotinate-nucleotide diphosphorylase [Hyphomicrobiaceae bacterium]